MFEIVLMSSGFIKIEKKYNHGWVGELLDNESIVEWIDAWQIYQNRMDGLINI